MADGTGAVQAGRPSRSDEELIEWISSCLKDAKKTSADWRKMARECYEFDAGRQWSDEDLAILDEQRRPAVTFNRVARTVNSVIGLEVQNRQEVRYLPREVSDSGFNEMLTEAAKWVRDQCDAENEESEAFRDTVVCGMGWTETRLDYETDPEGKICVDRIDPLEMFWDTKASKKNLADARWKAHVKKMTAEEIEELWPGKDLSAGESWLDEDQEEALDGSPPFYDGKESDNSSKKDKEVVQFQWYETEKYGRVLSNSGQILEFSSAKYSRLKSQFDAMGLRHVEQKRRVYYVAFLCGKTLLESRALDLKKSDTFHCMTGMRDRNARQFFGLVYLMLDPQRWANKWMSQILHILNSNAKGGLLAEKTAFDNPKRAEIDWPKTDAIVWMREGGLQKVQERAQGAFPSGFDRLMQYAIEAISDAPGVSSELMGLVGREQAGVLESMRKQAGVVMLATLFDAKRLYHKTQGRALAEYIAEYISDGRLVRIVGEDGQKYVPLIKDSVNFEYDVIVDEAPSSPNNKEKVTAVLMNLLPAMAQAGMPPPPPDILEFLPLPTSLTEKWLASTRPNPEMQQKEMQFAEMMKQLAAAKEQSEVALNEARAVLAQAQAQKAQMDSDPRAELMKAEMQAGIDMQKAEMQGGIEVQKAQMQGGIELQKAEMQGAIDLQKAQMQTGVDIAKAQISAEAQKQTRKENPPKRVN